MPIAFDAGSGSAVGGANSLTYAHVCTGSDRILLVGVNYYSNTPGPGDGITGVTYNGVPMTLIGKLANASALYANMWCYLYYLIAPATGSNNVVVSAGAVKNISSGSASYTGVKQTGQPDASTTSANADSSSSITIPLTTIADNCWMVSFCAGTAYTGGSYAPAGSTNVTERGSGQSNSQIGDNNAAKTPAGSLSQTWIPGAGGGTGSFTAVQASIAPVVAAGASTGRFRSLLGVGL